MLPFCPAGQSFEAVWRRDGFDPCFVETTSTSILLLWIFLVWAIEFYLYRQYSTRIEPEERRKTCLFGIQITATVLLMILAMARLVVQSSGLLPSEPLCGYMLVVGVCSFLTWALSLLVIIMERRYALPSIPTWGHSLGLLIFWAITFVVENLSFVNYKSDMWWFHHQIVSDDAELGFFVLRYICILSLFLIGMKAPGLALTRDALDFRIHNDRRRLVEDGPVNADGSFVRIHQSSTFNDLLKKLRLLMPFLWPKKSHVLQLYVIICFLLLALGRVVNVFTPIYYKKIVDSLSVTNESKGLVFRWDLILTYGGLMFLQGGGAGSMGLLNNARSFLWIRVQQFTTRELGVELFAHLHSLSLSWHLKRKTGEVLRAVDRGTNSISNLLNYILFNIMPTIGDIVIAIIYFITAFNAWFGLIIFVTMSCYLACTIAVTEWRTKYRRDMNQLDNAANARAVDSLLNFETVKYYAAEEFEVLKYREAILLYQVAEWKSNASMSLLNMVQGTIITTGLLVSALFCAHLVVDHQLTPGDYVLLGTYILQLYVPLNWFGTYYRMIQTAFVDMENMFDLLETDVDIKDEANALPLRISEGGLEFSNVSFSYVPERMILKNVSFRVPPGKTYALVGPTGSGKTTIIRLLFRFYDIQKGKIIIDGQNISHITQDSLRKIIGVVPQDTVLFNKTIKYNIHYGRNSADDDDVISAAKSAEIHDSIMTFPNEYETIVGERGLKLSGGEKQRVAIARTILKAPSIVLLDEATSALDTKTERQIQSALSKVCANKTTLVVAHRLSTIVNADEILVLKDGEIIERGSHEDLLSLGNLYASMWKQQLKENTEDVSNGPIIQDAAVESIVT